MGEAMAQGVTFVTVPEYQPSQAQITLGPQLYKPSQKAENVSVGRFGVDPTTIALIAVPVGIFFVWLLWRKKG